MKIEHSDTILIWSLSSEFIIIEKYQLSEKMKRSFLQNGAEGKKSSTLELSTFKSKIKEKLSDTIDHTRFHLYILRKIIQFLKNTLFHVYKKKKKRL